MSSFFWDIFRVASLKVYWHLEGAGGLGSFIYFRLQGILALVKIKHIQTVWFSFSKDPGPPTSQVAPWVVKNE